MTNGIVFITIFFQKGSGTFVVVGVVARLAVVLRAESSKFVSVSRSMTT